MENSTIPDPETFKPAREDDPNTRAKRLILDKTLERIVHSIISNAKKGRFALREAPFDLLDADSFNNEEALCILSCFTKPTKRGKEDKLNIGHLIALVSGEELYIYIKHQLEKRSPLYHCELFSGGRLGSMEMIISWLK